MVKPAEKAARRRIASNAPHRPERAGELVGTTYPAYVGLDVHEDTIAVAISGCGRCQPDYLGEIANTPKTVGKLIERLNAKHGGEPLLFVYVAGPCGEGAGQDRSARCGESGATVARGQT